MSLKDSNRKFERVEKQMKDKFTLTLSNRLIDSIAYLHQEVGNKEWSGVLVCKVTEGSIEDVSKLKIVAQDVLLMDEGTSGYTEYKFDSDDNYLMTGLTNIFSNSLKAGHLHTHHNMTCFFSKTDRDELHDNAANHNWYLSLIVNFKDYTNWCAKIAMEVDEEYEGTYKVTKKFNGNEGKETTVNEVTLDGNTKKYLYLWDADIEVEQQFFDIEQSLIDRLVEIREKKKSKFIHTSDNFDDWRMSDMNYGRQTTIWDKDDKEDKPKNAFEKLYTYEKVKPFVYKVLNMDMNLVASPTLWPTVDKLEELDNATFDMVMETIEDNIEEWTNAYFSLTAVQNKDLHYHYIYNQVAEVVGVFPGESIKEFLKLIDIYIIPESLLEYEHNQSI